MSSEANMSEEKAKKAMVDAARLADELRGEQELAQHLERERKLLECQAKEMQARLDEAESNALKGGKKAMNKMETRIRELESEMDAENRRFGDSTKNLRKSERRIKELTYASDEDRKNHERMQGLIDQLQGKIKSYKKQIEEAEEIAALNLAKYRQAQAQLGDSEERADLNEQALAKYKAKERASSLAPMVRKITMKPLHTQKKIFYSTFLLLFSYSKWDTTRPTDTFDDCNSRIRTSKSKQLITVRPWPQNSILHFYRRYVKTNITDFGSLELKPSFKLAITDFGNIHGWQGFKFKAYSKTESKVKIKGTSNPILPPPFH